MKAALGVTAVLAAAVPLSLLTFVEEPLRARAERGLSAGLGEEVTIGAAEAELVGTFRLEDVRVGERFAADAVEASVGLASLLRGTFGADEIRVEHPRLRAVVRADGSIDLADLLRRPRKKSAAGPRKLRKIVVTGGELVITTPDGEVRADGVEIHPQDGGARVVTGALSLSGARGTARGEASFARAGLDVSLPDLRVTRAALDGGALRLTRGGEALRLDRVVVVTTATSARLDSDQLQLRVTRDAGVVRAEVDARDLDLRPLSPRAGRVAGTAAVEVGPVETRVSGDLALTGWIVEHHLVDDQPVPFTGRLRGHAVTAGGQTQAALHVESGALAADIEAEWSAGFAAFAARVAIPETPCAGALAAIPVELRGGIDGLELSGTIAAVIDVAAARAAPEETRLELDIAMRCKVDRDPAAADAGALRKAYSHTLPDGTLRLMGEADGDFVPVDALPSHVAEAWVAAEDARFYHHRGFDAEQIRKSLAHDVAAGKVARGGSTISQQLVKNLWLGRERTLSRKLTEALLTWRLEQRVEKKRILEVYLNLVELGEGVYGIGPAARRWFGKDARDLDVAETAFLAALTPAPLSSERRIRAAGRLDPDTQRRVETVLRAMRRARVIDERERKNAAEKLGELGLRVDAS